MWIFVTTQAKVGVRRKGLSSYGYFIADKLPVMAEKRKEYL